MTDRSNTTTLHNQSVETDRGAAIALGNITHNWTITEATQNPEETQSNGLIFHAIISPSRSATIKQLHIVSGAMGALALLMGIIFIVTGAWPIAGFLGAEILLLYGALSYHHGGRNAREEIILDTDQLAVRRIGPWHRHRSWLLSPRWLQVIIESRSHGGDTLVLQSGPSRVTLGRGLSDREKAYLATRLRFALARVPLDT